MSFKGLFLKAGIDSDGKALHLFGLGGANTAKLLGAGTSSSKAVCDTADSRFINFNFDCGATTGDNRGMYLRLYLTGASTGGGEALRVFTTLSDSQGTAHGAHISLNFDTSKVVSGLGVAVRATLHIPNSSLTGTTAALQAEIYSDGASSALGGLTSAIRVVNDGNATGKGAVDDALYLFELSGFTAGAAHIFRTGLTAATVNAATTAALRIRVGATDYFIPLATATA